MEIKWFTLSIVIFISVPKLQYKESIYTALNKLHVVYVCVNYSCVIQT